MPQIIASSIQDRPPPGTAWRELQRRSARLHRLQAHLMHEFFAIDGPRWLGYARRADYVENRLEESAGRARVLARVGNLIRTCRPADEALATGDLSLSHADLIARRCPPETVVDSLLRASRLSVRQLETFLDTNKPIPAPPPCDATRDQDWVQVRVRAPAPVVTYVRETLSLARALIGHDGSSGDALEAVLAEASSELVIDADHASTPTGISHSKPHRKASPLARSRTHAVSLVRHGASARARAHRIDRRLLRIRGLAREQDGATDEFLLHCLRDGEHRRRGFRRFDDFAQSELGIAPSSAWDAIHRARARRREDPIALWLRSGRVGTVKARMLSALRRLGVTRRNLVRWLIFARTHTCRVLRSALAWARHRFETDFRSWSLAGCPTPNSTQLRTFTAGPDALLSRLSTPSHEPDSLLPHIGPLVSLEMTVESTIAESLDLCVRAARPSERAPAWDGLLRLCRLAREQWRVDIRPIQHPHRHVLERDHYRCAAPGCGARSQLEVHHLVFRSHGGTDDDANLVTLCATHHRALIHSGLCAASRQRDGRVRWSLGIDEKGEPSEIYLDDRRIFFAA